MSSRKVLHCSWMAFRRVWTGRAPADSAMKDRASLAAMSCSNSASCNRDGTAGLHAQLCQKCNQHPYLPFTCFSYRQVISQAP